MILETFTFNIYYHDMKRILLILLAIHAINTCYGQFDEEIISAHKAQFQRVSINESGGPFSLTHIELFKNPLNIKDTLYDAFVFKPAKTGYLYWVFEAGDWYSGWDILEAKNSNGEWVFSEFDHSADRKYIIQQSDYPLQADHEYIMWFNRYDPHLSSSVVSLSLNILPNNYIPLKTYFYESTLSGQSTFFPANNTFCETLFHIISNITNVQNDILGDYRFNNALEGDAATKDYYSSNVGLSKYSVDKPTVETVHGTKEIIGYIEKLATGVTDAGMNQYFNDEFDRIHACLGDDFKRSSDNLHGPHASYTSSHIHLMLYNTYDDDNGHFQITISVSYEN